MSHLYEENEEHWFDGKIEDQVAQCTGLICSALMYAYHHRLGSMNQAAASHIEFSDEVAQGTLYATPMV
jgi:hypothetical protein